MGNILSNIRAKQQDKQTQKLYDNVTKSLQAQSEAQENATSSYPLNDLPLQEEHPVGSLLLLRGAGPAAAKGLEWVGEKMMPSAFLKGVGQVFPKLAKATTAISPYADAGLLSYWGAQGLREAKQAAQNGDVPGAIAGASMAALPLMGIRPNLAQELTRTQKANEVARALNREIKGTEIADSPVTQNILAGKLGWAPRQSRVIWHNSESPISKLESTFPAWDTVERGAPLGHVWGTGSETNLGFIGKRPFHLRSTKPVEMNKPMVQLNESVGNGKNAVRNEILKYADQSGADAVNFSNIKDNTLSNQDVYAVFKDVDIKPKLSEAEKLGIPKGERSNPQALEDPQYWGYQQWNGRYNSAVESGNWGETQRLRDLHFKVKAPNTKVVDENGNPLHAYHGFLPSRRVFTKFKGVNFDVERAVKEGSKINHWKLSIPNEYRMTSYHTPNYNHALTPYASGHPDKVYDDYLYIKNPFTWNEENLHNILLNSGHKSEKIPFREPGHFRKIAVRDNNGNRIFKDSDKWIPEKSGFRYPQVSDWADFRGDSKTELMKLGYDGLYIPQYYDSYGAFVSPSQIKSADPITWNGKGEIVPIVKRDNFHNLDRRYKQGGILKAQKGKSLIKLINKTTKRPITFINDFSGVENIAKETVGFGGVRPNTGLTSLETENRSKQLIQSFEEMMKTRIYNSKRDAFLKNRIGKVWNELTPSEQYQAEVRFKEYWNK